MKAVLDAFDDQLSHQGEEVILDILKKEQYIFFDDKGDQFKTSKIDKMVQNHVENCCDCKEVKSIRDLIQSNQGTLLRIPDDVVPRVLAYADKSHQGFAEAYRRIKSWCDFTDFEGQVQNMFTNQKVYLKYSPSRFDSILHAAQRVAGGRPTSSSLIEKEKQSAEDTLSSSSLVIMQLAR